MSEIGFIFAPNFKTYSMKKVILLTIALIGLCSFTAAELPFRVEGQKVAVLVNNYDESRVYIRVTNEDSRVVYSGTFTDQEVGKLLNFENAYPGTYYILVKDGKETHNTSITVK